MRASDSPAAKNPPGPDFVRESELLQLGYKIVAGVDEAGRGPLAGPVVVAAVILDPLNIPLGLNDSKKLSAKRRKELSAIILDCATVCIVSAPPLIIEQLNIRGATLWAMTKAIKALTVAPDYALFDGRDIPDKIICKGEAIIKGDSLCLSIAAASIVAKVARDQMCDTLHQLFPRYGFGAHKGYGTAQHMNALRTHGATTHHRADFAPVRAAIQKTRR